MKDVDTVVKEFTQCGWKSYGVRSDNDPERSKYYPDDGVLLRCEEDTSMPRERFKNENPDTKGTVEFEEFAVLKFIIDTSTANYAFAREVEKARFYVVGDQVISSPMPMRPGPKGEIAMLNESVYVVDVEKTGKPAMVHTLIWPASDISEQGFISKWYCCGYP